MPSSRGSSGVAAFQAGAPVALSQRAHVTMEMKNTWTTETTTRRAALTSFAAAVPALAALPALAEPPPPAYALVKDYPKDARKMLDNMVIATGLARGSENMEYIVKSTRSEMNDFVAFYRRQPKVAGMPSFSTLYTAINTLSGHYASYGNKYPVPEKRRVRLQQQYKGKQQQHAAAAAALYSSSTSLARRIFGC